MKINIRLSAGLAYAAGQTRLSLTLGDSASVGDAIYTLIEQQPTLQGRLERALPMLGGRHVDRSTLLADGAELLLLLPAAGGTSSYFSLFSSFFGK
jgi:molybdopterin converting factor small subunit